MKRHHGLKILIVVLAMVSVLLIIKGRYLMQSKNEIKHTQIEAFTKKMGIEPREPNKLETYHSVQGMVHIEHWLTPQGVKVYFVHVPTLPMVDIEIVFDAGAARNGQKGGLAYLTNTLLAEGTPEMDADKVAENFDKVGAQFSAQSQRDMAIIQLRSLSDAQQLLPALETLSQILSKPSFPETGFKREQENALSMLKQQSQMPDRVASREFYATLYPNQPYSNWILGDEASLKALTTTDIKTFYQQYYTAKNAVITIVGDLSVQDADSMAQFLTQHLPNGEKAPPLSPITDITRQEIKKIKFSSQQTHILMGELGVKQGDPDYYALYLGNHILGGNGSVTRMFDIIRNQHGLAYSAYSYFLPMRERGPFILGCQTRNDQADKALGLMETLLKDFVTKGPTEKEVEQAKLNLLGGYALQFDSNAAILQQVAMLGFYDLPLDYFNQFKPAIEKLTAQEVKQTFQKRISPDKCVIVLLGGSE